MTECGYVSSSRDLWLTCSKCESSRIEIRPWPGAHSLSAVFSVPLDAKAVE